MKRIPRVLTGSPQGQLDAGIAVAGSRAGGLGWIDLGSEDATAAAVECIGRVGKLLKRKEFGLRLRADAVGRSVWEGAPGNLGVVVVCGGSGTDWARALDEVRGAGRQAMADVASRVAAAEALEAGFEALIVSGQEAGGFVGEESSFILLQAVLGLSPKGCRVWVRGGIGPNSAAGCVAAGASGVVLDGALLLARESRLPASVRDGMEHWDGTETTVFGAGGSSYLRAYAPPGSDLLTRARELDPGAESWASEIGAMIGWRDGGLWPAGQDAATAAALARRHVTVGGIVLAVERAIDEGLRSAGSLRPMAEGAPLAIAHRTRFPIVQGPMTRVSDRPAFSRAVADGGGLPFLALALMRGEEVRDLLAEAAETLGACPWGVGLLGFVPAELRREQTEAILAARPPFALIAGGRPDQARELDRAGVVTYLHAPSPALLTQFLRDGARRFVLEGRECGGHVGPRSSLLLWEQAATALHDAFETGTVEPADVHLLYAGGVHDACSSAVVAGASASLAARGVKVGVLVGTAYLFTREAVDGGAIVAGFQREALRCSATVLLETGPGHQVRVSPSAFTAQFESERRRLAREGGTTEEVRTNLEGLNVGRLRIAAKGVDRAAGTGPSLASVSPDDQRERGLFMFGQAATLRDRVTTIADLHHDIAVRGTERLEQSAAAVGARRRTRSKPSDVAIVGMAAIVPGAADLRRFWENTLRGRDAITEVPPDRWDWRLYYDADPKAPDKITSRWGGFVPEVAFDPLQYGMPPTSLSSIEPLHLLTLEVVRAALDDAGYSDQAFPRERTSVVLGAGGGAAQLAMGYAFRSYLPLLDTVAPGLGSQALARCGALLPEWTEDSFPGMLLNVAAGRVANRFDLGGANFTVDAACGSSLAAASLAVRELEAGAADVVVLGGADTVQNPFTYLAFSKTHAFSPRGRCRPFDAGADGIVISEGVAVVILKRLADAERDGDRVYAVIKGLGASSDGRAKGLTAPRLEGQVRALRRAYEKAGVSPATVGYVEAHGTGTAAGDLAEVSALKDVFRDAGAAPQRCALGSVKSQIGHTKCAAGLAGLINAALSVYHRVLPPTIGVERPSPPAGFSDSPFHLNTRPRPWLRPEPGTPRRAGVSAFGFGGTNFHAVIEAYEGEAGPTPPSPLDWPAELFLWQATGRDDLLAALDRLANALGASPAPPLRDLARTSHLDTGGSTDGPRLAIVAASADDLLAKTQRARAAIAAGQAELHDPTGIAYADRGQWAGARVAFLFPGQGSQSLEMLGEVAVYSPLVLDGLDAFDGALGRRNLPAVGPLVFPPISFDETERVRQTAALGAVDVAQPALGAVCVGLLNLLKSLRLNPDVLAGHSYGELVALHAAGACSLDALAELSASRGRFLREAVGDEPGAMAAVHGGPSAAEPLMAGARGLVVANWNGPTQTVVAGPRAEIERFLASARAQGLAARVLPVACGFHSPLVAAARPRLVELATRLIDRAPEKTVYTNVTGSTYPDDPGAIAGLLGDHLVSPVRFSSMIETMHDDGARVFVEVGPGSVLTGLVGSILKDQGHLALACDPPGRKGIAGLLATLGRLFVAGVSLDPLPLTDGRSTGRVIIQGNRFPPTQPALTPSTWLVDGNRARPAFGPEPPRFGPGPALPVPADDGSHRSPSRNGQSPESPGLPHPRPVELPAPSPVGVGVGDEAEDAVFAAFQHTMQTFLDVQRSTMLRFLGSEQGTHPPQRPEKTPHPSTGSTNGHAPEPPALAPTSLHPDEPKADDAESVRGRLLEIVRDRTGYPAEMLRLDLDLEADLGIDSIKRVEILGTLRDSLPDDRNGSESDLMEHLAGARTLGAIVDRVDLHLRPIARQETRSSQTPRRAAGAVGIPSARRMVLRAVDAPIAASRQTGGLRPGGLVLITDDGRGVARNVASRLRSLGLRPLRVGHSPGQESEIEAEVWGADFTSPDSVSRLADRVRAEGMLVALLHALPLRHLDGPGLDLAEWDRRLKTEVRGLFLLARACAGDLEKAAGQGGASIVAATGMGGGFASLRDEPGSFFAGHGAIAGLVKTLAREWPGVHARVVDLDPRDGSELLADRLTAELLTTDERAEVGYRQGRRIALRASAAELSTAEGSRFRLEPGAPILLTGGARGITAAVAEDLARRWRPTLLLVGTSPLPSDEEAPGFAGLFDPAEIKARLLQRLGPAVGPLGLEAAFQAFRRGREIRTNLRTLRAAGGAVEYAQADVRDADALGAVLRRWKDRYGPLAGLVHGAGVIQDKLLRDKSTESFDLVMSTKLGGALTLARLLDDEPLRFAAFFSSVAGRFGNRGQADYAAANDALNKLAVWLDRRWSARVVSLIWGPWSGVGMVSDLEGHLTRRGLGMIAPEFGRARLAEELMLGAKGDVEVIVAGELGNLAPPSEDENE